MTDSAQRARELLEITREAYSPSADDRQRVRQLIEGSLAGAAASGVAASVGGSASTAAASAAGAGATASKALASKVIISLAVAGAVGGGALAVDQLTEPAPAAPKAVTSHTQPPSEPAPVARAGAEPAQPEPAAEEPEAVASPSERSRAQRPTSSKRARARRVARGHKTARNAAPKAAPQGAGATRAELRLIRGASRSLSQAQPQRALALLARHESRFGEGALVHEREALRVIATCLSAGPSAARSLRTRFERLHAGSPFDVHIARACDR